MPMVYLAGPIKGRSYIDIMAWRADAQILLERRGIQVLDPCRQRLHLANGQVATEGVDEFQTLLLDPTIIVRRDKSDVFRCDAMLVRMDEGSASAGTLIEIGWADVWNKPIILWTNKGNPFLHHPFCRLMSGVVTDGLDVAVELTASFLAM